MNKLTSGNPKVFTINKSININGKEYNNLNEVPAAFGGLLADNDKNGMLDIVENAFSQIGNANVNTNIQNNPNYVIQDKSFNMDSGNSKTANKMKSGARNLTGGSFGQKNYSNANPASFSQKAVPFKIGNGIDTGLAKKFLSFFLPMIILIGILVVIYYFLVNYLGMTVSIK